MASMVSRRRPLPSGPMRPHALLALVAAALLLAGCGAAQESSADRFSGAEADVARVVEDLQSAAQSKDAPKICNEILARALVAQLKSARADCVDEMSKAIEDVDDFDLEVRDVSVTGTTARARVQQGSNGRQTTLSFARAGPDWRATALAG